MKDRGRGVGVGEPCVLARDVEIGAHQRELAVADQRPEEPRSPGQRANAVDAELGRIVDLLEARFPGDYVLLVTADHGQCPLPDSMGGVRLDPIQLERTIEQRFGPGLGNVVQYTAPSEVYLDVEGLRDAGATTGDVAAALQHLTYRQNLGPYVPASAIEQDSLDKEEFAAVLSADYIASVTDPARFGASAYTSADVDPGVPPTSLLD